MKITRNLSLGAANVSQAIMTNIDPSTRTCCWDPKPSRSRPFDHFGPITFKCDAEYNNVSAAYDIEIVSLMPASHTHTHTPRAEFRKPT